MIIALYAVLFISIFFVVRYVILYRRQIKEELQDNNIIDESKKTSKGLFNTLIKKFGFGPFSYNRIERYLKRNGRPLNLTPASYLGIKITFPLLLFYIFSGISRWVSISTLLVGYFLPNVLIYLNNKDTTESVRLELPKVCDSLILQLYGGAFITEALSSMYLVAKNKRFKTALSILASKIAITGDFSASLKDFNESFNTPDIDAFVVTLEQIKTTGKVNTALEDLSKQLKRSSVVLREAQTEKIDTTKQIILVLLFLGLVALVMLIMLTSLKEGATNI